MLLVVPRANRNRQAWLILILPLPLAAFWQVLWLVLGPSYALESMALWTTSLAIAWASVWLVTPWLGGTGRARACIGALGVMAAALALAYVGYFGLWVSAQTSLRTAALGVSLAVPLVVATALAARQRPAGRARPSFGWLALGLVVFVEVCVLVVMTPANFGPRAFFSGRFLEQFVLQSQPIVAALVVFLFLFNLPVMLLCSYNSCYRQRLETMFPAAGRPPAEPEDPMRRQEGQNRF
ncbi:MAG: hypothetical protein JW809_18610 [Pirellulales bacterium]|nr:hypothetical protein [Pirellulales bacterium]